MCIYIFSRVPFCAGMGSHFYLPVGLGVSMMSRSGFTLQDFYTKFEKFENAYDFFFSSSNNILVTFTYFLRSFQ